MLVERDLKSRQIQGCHVVRSQAASKAVRNAVVIPYCGCSSTGLCGPEQGFMRVYMRRRIVRDKMVDAYAVLYGEGHATDARLAQDLVGLCDVFGR